MNKKLFGIAATLISATYFGFMPLFMKTVYASGGNSFTAAFLRFALSLPTLYIYHRVRGISLKISWEEMKQVLIITLCGYGGTTILVFTAYNYIASGLATTIHFLYPTVTVAGLMIFYKEKIKPSKIFCVVLCLVGVLLFYNGGGEVSLKGILLALCSAGTYGFYTIYLGKCCLKDMIATKRLFHMHWVGALMMGVIGLVSGGFDFVMAPLGWGIMFLVATLTTFVGALGYQIGVDTIGSENTAMLSTFEPITSIIVGILVYSETMTVKIVLGILAILTSTVIIAKTESK